MLRSYWLPVHMDTVPSVEITIVRESNGRQSGDYCIGDSILSSVHDGAHLLLSS